MVKRTMLHEIKVAVNFLMFKIIFNLTEMASHPLPSGLSLVRLSEFRTELFQIMCSASGPTWIIGSPVRGQYDRAIRLHGEANDSRHDWIERALEACGLGYRELRLHELYMDLIVNPGTVFVIENEVSLTFLYDRTIEQLAEQFVDEVLADD